MCESLICRILDIKTVTLLFPALFSPSAFEHAQLLNWLPKSFGKKRSKTPDIQMEMAAG